MGSHELFHRLAKVFVSARFQHVVSRAFKLNLFLEGSVSLALEQYQSWQLSRISVHLTLVNAVVPC